MCVARFAIALIVSMQLGLSGSSCAQGNAHALPPA